ncbi:hypothetical protein [Acidiphilium sp.]|uniref:hypothetical protein n=1 Tax=Acidiphilium sp. TaxID=527 RepID=UPI003CFE53E4
MTDDDVIIAAVDRHLIPQPDGAGVADDLGVDFPCRGRIVIPAQQQLRRPRFFGQVGRLRLAGREKSQR